MDCAILVNFALLATFGGPVEGKLLVKPRDTDVKVNHSTYFNCSTDHGSTAIFWFHGTKHVYTGISILEPYNERFQIDRYVWNGTYIYNLVIHSVQIDDAGEYTCAEDEGVGEQYSIQVVVIDGDPIFRSNIELDKVIGKNTCNVEPDAVELSCSGTYHGNVPPQLEWKKDGEDRIISEGLSNVTSSNHYNYILKLKGATSFDKSFYFCQATRTVQQPYQCVSRVINVMYALSDNSIVNRTIDDQIICQANTTQSCSYQWRWFQNNDVTTESYSATLKPRKTGLHQCEAECYLRNKTCNLLVMQAMVYGDAESSQMRNVIISVSVVVAVVLIAALMFFFRHRNKNKDRRMKNGEEQTGEDQMPLNEFPKDPMSGLPEKYKSNPFLIETIRIKATEEGKKFINGLTILDKELFVVNGLSSQIEVYDSIKLSFIRQFHLEELHNQVDIASCSRNKCLYICKSKYSQKSTEILSVDPSGKLIKKWSTGGDYGQSVSVTYESNVILALQWQNELNEYSADGELIRKINLSYIGVRYPWHAIKLANGHFVVSHGIADDLHRVCLVDADGKLMKSFGGNRGSSITQMNRTMHLSVDGNGFVFVADERNDRVLLLDSNLEFKRAILTAGKQGLRYPQRIILDESTSRAFVAELSHTGSTIKIFRLLLL